MEFFSSRIPELIPGATNTVCWLGHFTANGALLSFIDSFSDVCANGKNRGDVAFANVFAMMRYAWWGEDTVFVFRIVSPGSIPSSPEALVIIIYFTSLTKQF